MSEKTKFSFERDFRSGSTSPFVERRMDPTVPLARHEEALRETDASAFLRGHVAGIDAARLEQTARLASATEELTHILRQSAGRLDVIEQQASHEALHFAFKFAKILSADLIGEKPLAPVEAAARHVFGDLRGLPHVAVRVAPDLVEATKESLSRIAREIGLDAKIIVLGEPEIRTSDCRIEWADGGIIRNQSALEAQLQEAIATALGQARQMSGKSTTEPAY